MARYIEPDPQIDYVFRLLMIGDSGVGKSSVLSMVVDHHFDPCFISTIGVDFKQHLTEINDKIVRLQIWDTAGQERFNAIINTYYRGAHGVIIMYDISDIKSFHNVQKWNADVDKYAPGIPKLLIGNKSDLIGKRQVDTHIAQEYATANGMSYIETSALADKNIQEAFHTLGNEIYNVQKFSNDRKVKRINNNNNTIAVQGTDLTNDRNTCC